VTYPRALGCEEAAPHTLLLLKVLNFYLWQGEAVLTTKQKHRKYQPLVSQQEISKNK
jgi:hypothetical protein